MTKIIRTNDKENDKKWEQYIEKAMTKKNIRYIKEYKKWEQKFFLKKSQQENCKGNGQNDKRKWNRKIQKW